jgi:hypothetical protein
MTTLAHQDDTLDESALLAALRSLAAAVFAAAVSGLLVGGVIGRLGMRLLALTSPEIAQGRLTDDAARVGQFTLSGSLFLAVSLAVGTGLVIGPVYLVTRRALPSSRRGRVAGFALLTGAVGGALFVHDHPSFDYSILAPAWLAVAIFVLVPALAGAVTALLTEVLAPPPRPRFPGTWAMAWRSRPVTVAARGVFWIVVVWGVYNIGADAWSLITDTASSAPLTV